MADNVNILVTNGCQQRSMFNTDTVLDLASPGNAMALQIRALRPLMSPANARVFVFTAPAAKAAGIDDIVAGLAGNAVSNIATLAGQPATPRNMRVIGNASWDGGDVTILGTDYHDAVVSETFTSAQVKGLTAIGLQPFKTVTSVTKSLIGVSSTTIKVGIGDALQVHQPLIDTVGIAFYGSGTWDAPTLDATYHTYTPTSAPDGSKTFILLANV